jgi:hypothetical protein
MTLPRGIFAGIESPVVQGGARMIQIKLNFKSKAGVKAWLAAAFLVSFSGQGQVVRADLGSESTLPKSYLSESDYVQRAAENLRIQNHRASASIPAPLRPVTDFDNFKYLLMSGDFSFDSQEMKRILVQNLPPRMKVVLLVYPGEQDRVRQVFAKWISDPSRLILVAHSTARSGFWARDAFPFPVHLDPSLTLGLVASKYDRPFEAHESIASGVGGARNLTKYSHTFVGGNLLADESGRCFVVESRRLFGLRDGTLKQSYGCKEVYRLKHLSGIGDVDEVIKLLPRQRALTNRNEYVPLLKSLGYQVLALPGLSGFRTYANSVIIDDIVFLPQYNRPEDHVAAEVYKTAGYRVIFVPSEVLASEGKGSVHCATMTYPAIKEEVLLRMLNLERL